MIGLVILLLNTATIAAATTAAISIVMTKASITLLSASLYTETGVAMVILPTLLGNAVR